MNTREQIIRLATALETSTRLLTDPYGDGLWMAWLSYSEWVGRADTEEGALRNLRNKLRARLQVDYTQRLRVIALEEKELADDRAMVLRAVAALDETEE